MTELETPQTGAPSTLPSGIDCLDERLGGLAPGRTYALSGAPGTGKTVVCLEFLNQGIEHGERCALLTVDDPADVLSQAEFLGLDFEPALRDERLILLRYQLDFLRRFGRIASLDEPFAELRSLLGEPPPVRFVVDSAVPFLDAGPASGAGVRALVAFLDRLGSTTLITMPGDLSETYDRRLEPLAQRAAAILHLATDREGLSRIELQKVRVPVASAKPIRCRIQAGRGIVPASDAGRRVEDVPDETRRRILLLNLSGSFPTSMLQLLRERFDVRVHDRVVGAFSSLASAASGAVLIDVHRESLGEALTLVRELRYAGSRAPVVFVTSFRLRSNDRARALRVGADEFLSSDIAPDEFLLRVDAAVRRGRSFATPTQGDGLPLQQTLNGSGYVALGENEFKAAIRSHVDRDPLPFFTVVTIRPPERQLLPILAALTIDRIRAAGGDLAGEVDGSVAVYLHAARRKDVAPFIDRVRSAWAAQQRGELLIETTSWPGDDGRIEQLIGAAER